MGGRRRSRRSPLDVFVAHLEMTRQFESLAEVGDVVKTLDNSLVRSNWTLGDFRVLKDTLVIRQRTKEIKGETIMLVRQRGPRSLSAIFRSVLAS